MRLLLLPDDPEQIDPLMHALPTTEIDDVVKIRKALMPYRGQVTEELWQWLENPKAAPGNRLRAAAVLAVFEPTSPRWEGLGDAIVAILVTRDSAISTTGCRRCAPIRGHLMPR